MIYRDIINKFNTKIRKKKELLNIHFLDTYESKYDNMYISRCNKWDSQTKPMKTDDITDLAQFYYMGYTEKDIIKLAKTSKIDSKNLTVIIDDGRSEIQDPRFINKTIGEIFYNGGGDIILYCIEDKKFYLYLHEESDPIVDSMSFNEFMNISKKQFMENPIYKERYKNK